MILPDTIAFRIGRTMLGLVLLMTISFAALHFFTNHEDDDSPGHLANRISGITEIADAIPRSARPALIASLQSNLFTVDIGEKLPPDVAPRSNFSCWAMRRGIEAGLNDAPHQVIVGLSPSKSGAKQGAAAKNGSATPAQLMVIQVQMSDGEWLRFVVDLAGNVAGFPFRPFAVRVGYASFMVWLLSIWTARRLAAPIAAFAKAADRLGRDADAAPLIENGPRELRMATRAFNQMQDRLQRLIRDRTQMLAAMSHDLRTPLTRMTLRSESIENPKVKGKMLADLEEMTSMIESSLTFAREDFNRETRTLVDLRALIENICEDAVDTGASVSCRIAEGVDLECRPQALRRAITNLVDNALKYGGAAHLTVLREPGRVVILVDDDGPGIPPEQQEKVFAPFYRLESSRNRETGGAGLGLALVRTIAHGHGGSVVLANRPEGGLRARLELPG